MPEESSQFQQLAHDALAFGGVELSVAAGVWIFLRFSLPREHRAKLIVPALLLLSYVVIAVAKTALPSQAPSYKYVGTVALLLLLLGCGRLVTIFVIDWLITRRLHRPTPKIIRDIVEGMIVMGAVLLTLRAAGVDATSLLTTSALLTAIIGLSLQDTLGNLFAGLSLQAEEPFRVGDWIQYDREAGHIGQVKEINWRATKMINLDLVEITIPNGQLARASIVNFTKPSALSRRQIVFTIPHDFAPLRVKQVIERALTEVPGMRSQPPPSVITHEIVERGIEYCARFFIENFAERELIDAHVRDRVWYALSRVQIPIATPVQRMELREHTRQTDADDAREEERARARAVRKLDFLRDLPDEAIQTLAHQSSTALYEPDEIVVRQGEHGGEFYVCLEGELSVLHSTGGGPRREVARLGPGGIFGEVALMTGQQRTATVKAVTPCRLLTLGKTAFSEILAKNPQLAERISERLAERQATLMAFAESLDENERKSIHEDQNQLLDRIRRFFSL